MSVIPIVLLGAGTLGYHLIEGWRPLDAFYMTVITLTTVGFQEVHPLSSAGRIFTAFLSLGGVFTLFYVGVELVGGVVSGEVRKALWRQRMARNLSELKNHLVVCGFVRMGHLVCREFSKLGLDFVVIDRLPELLRDFAMPHGIALHGDATSEEILRKAGVERARGLVTAAASDADNLYVTMSARLLNERLFIVARAEEEGAEKKLLRAGANRVVSPYAIGGQRVAQAVLRPAVTDFIELATRSEHLELQIEETEVSAGSRLAGGRLKESGLRQELGIIIVAVKRPDGKMVFNPSPDMVIAPDDILITLGPRHQLDRLEEMAKA